MTALTNRGLALKLAVEHATSSGGYDLLQADDSLQEVFGLAEKFASWIGGQPASDGTAQPAAAAAEAPAPARTASDAVDAILGGIAAQVEELGVDVVQTAQRELARYRSYSSFGAVIAGANQAITNNVQTIGTTAADRLRRIVRDAS